MVITEELLRRIVNGDVVLTLDVAARALQERQADIATEIADFSAGLPVDREEVAMVVYEALLRDKVPL
jgi:hypothetical protein